MPKEQEVPEIDLIDLEADNEPMITLAEQINESYALTLVTETFNRLEAWRGTTHDPRWRLNEWLYYGYVPPRTWEGTSIPRASIPDEITFDQVETAFAILSQELLNTDEILGIEPTGSTTPTDAEQIKNRLLYIMDHNIDDYGWTGRLECELALKDLLIYGTCFGLVEYDYEREQATVLRLDPRDVYVDPGCAGPYIEKSRATIIRRPMTIDDLWSLRDVEGFKIPSKAELNSLSKNRGTYIADQDKMTQELARNVTYVPPSDDRLPMPSSKFIDVLIYQGGGREIWVLNNKWVAFNQSYPYKCMRIVSAPCFTVPNRFYAKSLVDALDNIQQTKTALLNRHLDEMALALNPPRTVKRGLIQTPSSLAWRPGLLSQVENPKEDMIVHPPQGITNEVWQDLAYQDQLAQNRTGITSGMSSGDLAPSNANRTKGGIQLQMQGPQTRLSQIAKHFENYFLVPMCYKMLRTEKTISEFNEQDDLENEEE